MYKIGNNNCSCKWSKFKHAVIKYYGFKKLIGK